MTNINTPNNPQANTDIPKQHNAFINALMLGDTETLTHHIEQINAITTGKAPPSETIGIAIQATINIHVHQGILLSGTYVFLLSTYVPSTTISALFPMRTNLHSLPAILID